MRHLENRSAALAGAAASEALRKSSETERSNDDRRNQGLRPLGAVIAEIVERLGRHIARREAA